MKTRDKDAKEKPSTAEHAAPPELQLQVCAKCQANYNRASLTACPKCQEPRPELPAAVDAPKAPIEVVPEFPYIAQPAMAGGVILRVDGGKVFRPMTQDDVNAAAEEIGTVSERHGEVSKFLVLAENNVQTSEQRLKDDRGIVRNTEIQLLDVGAQLATLGRAVRSGKREWNTQIVMTITPQNEVVYTDAKTGEQIGEKRTATADEMKQATNRQAALLNPDAPKDLATPIDDAKKSKKRRTSDSPHAKPDPGHQPVKVSLSTAAFNRLTPMRKAEMRKVAGLDDDPPFALNWAVSEDAERMSVEIPRRLLGTLMTMAGPTLDFKQDGVTLEIQ